MIPLIGGVAGSVPLVGGEITLVQQKLNTILNSAGQITTTYDSTPTENNLLIAQYFCTDDNTIVLTPPSGWSTAFNVEVDYAGGAVIGRVACYYKTAGASESTDVLVDNAATVITLYLGITEWSGMATSSPLDVVATNDETDTTQLDASSGVTAASALANSLAVALVNETDDDFDAVTTGHWNTGYTMLGTQPFTHGSGIAVTPTHAYNILSATGVQEGVCTYTGGPAEEVWGGIAVFKGA